MLAARWNLHSNMVPTAILITARTTAATAARERWRHTILPPLYHDTLRHTTKEHLVEAKDGSVQAAPQ